MAKPKLKLKARKMRAEGKSIKFIAKELMVAQSTASLWCRDIILTEAQIKQLEKQSKDPFYGKRLENARNQQRARIEKTKKLYTEALREIGVTSKKELLVAGVSLYWAEGFKKDNQAGFSNSDPEMVKFFIYWLKTCFSYTNDDLRIRISANVSHKYRISEIEDFWSNLIGIKASEFQKPFFQRVKWKKVYENPNLYFGIARIRVRRSSDFLRKLQGYILALKMQTT